MNSLVFPLVSSSQSVVVVCFTELLGTALRYVIKNVALSLSLSLSEELRFVFFYIEDILDILSFSLILLSI